MRLRGEPAGACASAPLPAARPGPLLPAGLGHPEHRLPTRCASKWRGPCDGRGRKGRRPGPPHPRPRPLVLRVRPASVRGWCRRVPPWAGLLPRPPPSAGVRIMMTVLAFRSDCRCAADSATATEAGCPGTLLRSRAAFAHLGRGREGGERLFGGIVIADAWFRPGPGLPLRLNRAPRSHRLRASALRQNPRRSRPRAPHPGGRDASGGSLLRGQPPPGPNSPRSGRAGAAPPAFRHETGPHPGSRDRFGPPPGPFRRAPARRQSRASGGPPDLCAEVSSSARAGRSGGGRQAASTAYPWYGGCGARSQRSTRSGSAPAAASPAPWPRCPGPCRRSTRRPPGPGRRTESAEHRACVAGVPRGRLSRGMRERQAVASPLLGEREEHAPDGLLHPVPSALRRRNGPAGDRGRTSPFAMAAGDSPPSRRAPQGGHHWRDKAGSSTALSTPRRT